VLSATIISVVTVGCVCRIWKHPNGVGLALENVFGRKRDKIKWGHRRKKKSQVSQNTVKFLHSEKRHCPS